jgi:hypothetical protein
LYKKDTIIKNLETIIGRIGFDVNHGTNAINRFVHFVEDELLTAKEFVEHASQFCEKLIQYEEESKARGAS